MCSSTFPGQRPHTLRFLAAFGKVDRVRTNHTLFGSYLTYINTLGIGCRACWRDVGEMSLYVSLILVSFSVWFCNRGSTYLVTRYRGTTTPFETRRKGEHASMTADLEVPMLYLENAKAEASNCQCVCSICPREKPQ